MGYCSRVDSNNFLYKVEGSMVPVYLFTCLPVYLYTPFHLNNYVI